VPLDRARGFFGRARDLLARIVEQGLHLPDAADRIRARAAGDMRIGPDALPTVTLAEIYAAQGHHLRAIETLKSVLEREPDHEAARELLERLEREPPAAPASVIVLPDVEADERTVLRMADVAASREPGRAAADAVAQTRDSARESEPPPPSDDECVAVPARGGGWFVHVHLSDDRVRDEGDAIELRVMVVRPTWDGPMRELRACRLRDATSPVVVRAVPAAVVRVAVGRLRSGRFEPLAHSPALEPMGGVDVAARATDLVRWTPHGFAPVEAGDHDAPAIARALSRANVGGATLDLAWTDLEPVPLDDDAAGGAGRGERVTRLSQSSVSTRLWPASS
jgi:hypothetical protein